MNIRFTYYDVLAIYIPGLFFSILVSFFLVYEGEISFKDNLTLGISLSMAVIVAAYAIGELIHSVSEFLQPFFWKLFGGWPALWIADEEKSWLGKVLHLDPYLVSPEDKSIIVPELRVNKSLQRKDIDSRFFNIKANACSIEGIKDSLDVMRSMAGFHSSMAVVTLLLACMVPSMTSPADKAAFVGGSSEVRSSEVQWTLESQVNMSEDGKGACSVNGKEVSVSRVDTNPRAQHEGNSLCASALRYARWVFLLMALLFICRFYHFTVNYVKYLYVGYALFLRKKDSDPSNQNKLQPGERRWGFYFFRK